MTDRFGGGIYLTTQSDLPPVWDLQVDSSGDIKTIPPGQDELQKDIAYSTSVRIEPEIGNRLEPIVLNRIKARVRDALNDEDRIDTIAFIEANDVGNNTVEVVVEAIASDQRVELVFEVEQ